MAGAGRNFTLEVNAFISAALKAQSGPRTESISLKGLHRKCFEDKAADPTLNQLYRCKTCGETVTRDQTLKGYEIAKGVFVPLTDEEIAAQVPASSEILKLQGIVPLTEVSRYRRDKAFFLGPQAPPKIAKGKVSFTPGHKVFQLIRDYLLRTQSAAVVSYVDRNHEKLGVIEADPPGMVLWEGFFDGEIPVLADQFKDGTFQAVPVSADEVNMFDMVLGTLCKPEFDWSAYSDGYVDRVIKLANAKQAGEAIVIQAQPPNVQEPTDLLAALAASLAASGVSKPPVPVTPPVTEKKAKKSA